MTRGDYGYDRHKGWVRISEGARSLLRDKITGVKLYTYFKRLREILEILGFRGGPRMGYVEA